MTVLLFWNAGGHGNGTAIGQLCGEHDVDIVLLAEVDLGSGRLVTEINNATGSGQTLWELPHPGSRVRALTRYAPGLLEPIFDDEHVKMLEFKPRIGQPLLIVAAHLPSKLWAREEDQALRIRRLRADISEQEIRLGHQNTVVIGDLNVNPFEDALTAADGLQGVMDREVASRPARIVQGRPWDYFYNPMWSRLGDESAGPPGTYWRAGSSLVNHFWNTFDQVLLRPGLLPYYDPTRLLVAEKIGDRSILARESEGPGLSDHLPIVIDLPVEMEKANG